MCLVRGQAQNSCGSSSSLLLIFQIAESMGRGRPNLNYLSAASGIELRPSYCVGRAHREKGQVFLSVVSNPWLCDQPKNVISHVSSMRLSASLVGSVPGKRVDR